jgi:hypothetical protein
MFRAGDRVKKAQSSNFLDNKADWSAGSMPLLEFKIRNVPSDEVK